MSQNSKNFPKPEKFPKIWNFSEILKFFQKIWKFSENLNFSKNMKIFQKYENFLKIWTFSENLNILQKFKFFPIIQIFSKSEKIVKKVTNTLKRNDFIDVPLASEDSSTRSQSELSNGHKFITYSFEDTLEQQRHHWCTPGLWR